MKTLLIEARQKFDESKIDFQELDKVKGKTVSLAATIQYIDLVPKIKKYLESIGKKVLIKKGAHYDAHVLGCNSTALDKDADTVLMITDGKFHAMNNAIQLQSPIVVFNTFVLEEVTLKDIEEHNKKTLAKQKKFLLADTVALILSSKHGQHHKQISKVKQKIEELEKRVYIFESNNINKQEFENFPQIQIWINTACFGLARDDPRIINLQDIQEFLK